MLGRTGYNAESQYLIFSRKQAGGNFWWRDNLNREFEQMLAKIDREK